MTEKQVSYYVYEHLRPDTGAVFYVGKGYRKRKASTTGRNQHWKRVVAKAGGFSIRMVAENVDEELAFLVEIERISQLRFLGVKLCNMTDGGEGLAGHNFSDAHRAKLSAANRKRTYKPVSDATRKKLSEAHKGRTPTEAHKKSLSAALKGRVASAEARQNMSKAQAARQVAEAANGRKPMSEEHLKKLIASCKGRVLSEEAKKKIGDANRGRVVSVETRAKISAAGKGRTLSDEHKKKLIEANRKRKGRVMSDASRKKMSDAHKKRFLLLKLQENQTDTGCCDGKR